MKLLGQRPLPWVARGGARQLAVVHADTILLALEREFTSVLNIFGV